TDTYPEHEVHDGKAPGNRMDMTPSANAFPHNVAEAGTKQAKKAQGKCESNVPRARRARCLHDARYVVRDLGERIVAHERTVVRVSGGRCGHRWSQAPDGGLRCARGSSPAVGC